MVCFRAQRYYAPGTDRTTHAIPTTVPRSIVGFVRQASDNGERSFPQLRDSNLQAARLSSEEFLQLPGPLGKALIPILKCLTTL
jgi:hypothetical protein